MAWRTRNKKGGDYSYFALDASIPKIGSKPGFLSLEGIGTHFDGPKTGGAIGLGSFKLKLMRPGQNDIRFTLSLASFETDQHTQFSNKFQEGKTYLLIYCVTQQMAYEFLELTTTNNR